MQVLAMQKQQFSIYIQIEEKKHSHKFSLDVLFRFDMF